MDFKDSIKQISAKIEKLGNTLKTEEATKNALIMPFLQAIGYDVFDPTEVLPEMVCDVGTKKGEKIDYAIFQNGNPIILIECKNYNQNLDNHSNQLLRYFGVSSAKFGILTNGIEYRFYTDLDKANVMDEVPFLEINLTDIKDSQIEELKKFHKSYLDINTILSSANDSKHLNAFKHIIEEEFTNPSANFTKFLAKQFFTGSYTAKVADHLQILLKKAIQNHINEVISVRLNTVIENQEERNSDESKAENELQNNGIETTQEELDAFNIVRSILRKEIDVSRIQFKDNKSYFVVNVDGKWKWICRLHLNSKYVKYISFPYEDYKGGEEKMEIKQIDEIFNYSEKLLKSLKQATM